MNRRGFLTALGIGATAVAIEPVRKLWFVGSNAPVGSRGERVSWSKVDDGLVPDPDLLMQGNGAYDAIRQLYGDPIPLVGVDPAARSYILTGSEASYPIRRVGSTDLTFAAPGEGEPWFFGVDAAAYPEWRAGQLPKIDAHAAAMKANFDSWENAWDSALPEIDRITGDMARQLQSFGKQVISVPEPGHMTSGQFAEFLRDVSDDYFRPRGG
jgi:hypothetical protein